MGWDNEGASARSATRPTTAYFREQVRRKRPYLLAASIEAVLSNPSRSLVQSDGRIRFWGRVLDWRDGKERMLRVVTLEDGTTVHNAFYDRGESEPLT